MSIFSDIPNLKDETDLLTGLIDKYEKLFAGSPSGSESVTRQCMEKLRSTRDQCAAEYAALMESLNRIREDDPEVYELILWHDVKGCSWHKTYIKACDGLYSLCSPDYGRIRVYRYLKKHGLIQRKTE